MVNNSYIHPHSHTHTQYCWFYNFLDRHNGRCRCCVFFMSFYSSFRDFRFLPYENDDDDQ